MKKQYITPSIDTYALSASESYLNTIVMSAGNGQAQGGGGAVKGYNQTEDADTYRTPNGADEVNYGDL